MDKFYGQIVLNNVQAILYCFYQNLGKPELSQNIWLSSSLLASKQKLGKQNTIKSQYQKKLWTN